MFNPFKRRWVKVLSIGMVLFLSSITIALAVLLRDNRPPDVKAYMDLRFEWEKTRRDPASSSKLNEEWAAIKTTFAERSLALADAHPNTATEIATLQMASSWAPKTALGQTATERLGQCVVKADLDQLASGITSFGLPGIFVHEVAPLIVDRIQDHLNHAVAVTLLSYACSASGSGSEAEVVPPAFAKAVELLVTNFVQSDGLEPFCGALGNGYYSPHWAAQFEPQLRTILRVNQSRWIRCCASLALASIVQSNPDRQPEAEKLLEEHLQAYDGKIPGQYQHVESELHRRATVQLEALKHSPLWKPSPENAGVDQNGNTLCLSEHRGKVVMVSFWATWCGPCMKLIPHEREIATQHADDPFILLGVNADQTDDETLKRLASLNIPWPSFRDIRPGQKPISEEWQAYFPTVLLIDHKGIMRKRFSALSPAVMMKAVDDLVNEAKAEAQKVTVNVGAPQ